MVEAATNAAPDLIVADITMPLLNGIEALEELRKEGLDIPVVFLTMHRETEYASLALEAGAAGYVLKHAAPEELVQAVRVALEGGTFVSPRSPASCFKRRGRSRDGNDEPRVTLSARQRDDPAPARGRPFGKGNCQGTRHIVSHGRIPQVQAHGVAWLKNSAELIQFAIKQGIV